MGALRIDPVTAVSQPPDTVSSDPELDKKVNHPTGVLVVSVGTN